MFPNWCIQETGALLVAASWTTKLQSEQLAALWVNLEHILCLILCSYIVTKLDAVVQSSKLNADQL